MTSSVALRWQRVESWMTTSQHRLRGVALLRVLTAMSMLHFYVTGFADRHFLWGPHGIGLGPIARGASLYGFATSSSAFDVLFAIGIAATLAQLLVGGRLICAVSTVFFLSLLNRNGLAMTGGENLLRVALPFLCITRNNAYYAVITPRRVRPGPLRSLIVVHNAAVTVLVIQVLIVYAMSGYWKLVGQPWQRGLAVYQISQVEEFRFAGLPFWLVSNPFVATFLAYAVTALLLWAPISVITRRWTALTVALLATFHLTIAVTMGLVGFAIAMIAGDAMLLPTASVAHAHESVTQLLRRVVARWSRAEGATTTTPAPSLDTAT